MFFIGSAAKEMENKTNVMRILEKAHIAYTSHEYPHGKEAVDGLTVAALLGQNPKAVFKTLVARSKSGGIAIFSIPVTEELDLKKAANAINEKAVSLVHVKELLELTGYLRGGCSPIGLKKPYPVVFEETITLHSTVMVSAGKIGYQVEMVPKDLITLVGAKTADIIQHS